MVTDDLNTSQLGYIESIKLGEASIKLGFFETNFSTGNGYVDGGFVLSTIILLALTFKMLVEPITNIIKVWRNK